MRAPVDKNNDLFLFPEGLPCTQAEQFRSECPPDKKTKVEDLFQFSRGRGDLHISIIAACLALFFFAMFFTQTGWDNRKLPDGVASYLAHQFGLIDLDGKITRFGRILKQSWVAPMFCLTVLVPTALWNLRASLKEHLWRKRFLLPTKASFEVAKYIEAFEFVIYFIAYTMLVPIFGYLLATVFLGVFLPWRLGYRGRVWVLRSFSCSVAVVIVFRTLLQIKTPVSIWLYDLMPTPLSGFLLTYF